MKQAYHFMAVVVSALLLALSLTSAQAAEEVDCRKQLTDSNTVTTDNKLTQEEYLLFLQARYPNCTTYTNASDLSLAQATAFRTAACVQSPLECFNNPTWDLEASDSGADGSWCVLAGVAALTDGCTPPVDSSGEGDGDGDGDGDGGDGNGDGNGNGDTDDEFTFAPGQDRDDCVMALNASDADQNMQLSLSEYFAFVQQSYETSDGGMMDCPIPEALSSELNASFAGLACASCAATATDPISDCNGDRTAEDYCGSTDVGYIDISDASLGTGWVCAAVRGNIALECGLYTLNNRTSQCTSALAAADANQNDYLNMNEYTEYVQSLYQENENCNGNVPDTLSFVEMAAFATLSCLSCKEDLLCGCGTSLARVSLSTSITNAVNVYSLCATAEASVSMECIDLSLPPAFAPTTDIVDNVTAACVDSLMAVDSNQDNAVDLGEFETYVKGLYGEEENCEAPEELPAAQRAAFATAACTSCISDPNCGCNSEDARVYVEADLGWGQTLVLQSLCTTAEAATRLDCTLGGASPTAPPPSRGENVTSACVGGLRAVDVNGDDFLDRSEFETYVQDLYQEEDTCEIPAELPNAQLAAFKAAACASCFNNQDQQCFCGTDEARVYVEADPNWSQSLVLQSLCTTAQAAVTLDCKLGGTAPTTSTVAPPNVTTACVDDLRAADADKDGAVDLSEFETYVEGVYEEEDCEVPEQLTDAQRAAFETTVCASCFSDQECGCGTEAARVTVEADPNWMQTLVLQSLCTTARAAARLDCKLGGDGSGENVTVACVEDLRAVDANGDDFLDLSDFETYVQGLYQQEDTCEEPAELPNAQRAAFEAASCASCSDDQDCGCNTELARVYVEADPNWAQTLMLRSLCATARAAVMLDCNLDGAAPAPPTAAPAREESTPPPSTAPTKGPTASSTTTTAASPTQAPTTATPTITPGSPPTSISALEDTPANSASVMLSTAMTLLSCVIVTVVTMTGSLLM